MWMEPCYSLRLRIRTCDLYKRLLHILFWLNSNPAYHPSWRNLIGTVIRIGLILGSCFGVHAVPSSLELTARSILVAAGSS